MTFQNRENTETQRPILNTKDCKT